MKLLYAGIHKNIGFIVQHTNGYNKEYHITMVAQDLNINRDIISNLFRESSSSNILHYLDLLKNGMSIDKIFKMVDYDNKIFTMELKSSLSLMENIMSKCNYYN